MLIRIDMIGYRILSVAAVLGFLFAGCSHNTIADKSRMPALTKNQPFETAASSPSFQPPENNGTTFYGIAKGNSEEEAKEKAVSDLNRRVWSGFLAKTDSDSYGHRRLFKYISKKYINSAKKLLKKVSHSKYRVLKSYSLDDGTIAAVVEIKRKDMAGPLKKKLIGRLVSVEERWHTSRGQTVLERYLLAEDSFKKMQQLLPGYLLADYISPFSTPVAGRVENGVPYFDKTVSRLKKRLRFCIEPVSTPAMRLFADAVAKVLKKERLISTDKENADSRTLCITLKGHLLHKQSAQRHIFEATVKITLHKRYKAPISIQLYKVRGVSEESGTRALEKAAQALQRELEKRFLQTV